VNRILRTSAATLLALIVVSLPTSRVDAKNGDYEITFLSVPAGAYNSWANSVTDGGTIVGGYIVLNPDAPLGWEQFAVVWENADAEPVTLPGRTESDITWATAINNDGQVCGAGVDLSTWQIYAALWDKDGRLIDSHPDLGFEHSEFVDQNHHGDAVGGVYDSGGWGYAFVQPAGGTPYLLDLDLDLYLQSWPYAINKEGTVVGFARSAVGTTATHAAFWSPDGEMTDLNDGLTAIFGEEDVMGSKAWWVSDKGEIGGVVAMNSGDVYPWVWTARSGFTFIDTGDHSAAAIWGGEGQYMVGMVNAAVQTWSGYGSNESIAAVWDRSTSKGETVWRLTQLATPEGYEASAVISANASGAVVGIAKIEGATWYDEYFAWYAKR
jgi:probable HAF family extracellular repeat protein